MPFFSCVAMSASIVLPRRHSSMKACSAGFFAPAASAIGCSAAIAMNVTPNKVSARVVNTLSAPSAPISALVSGAIRERDLAALGLADPVGLHRLHALGPVGQLLEIA